MPFDITEFMANAAEFGFTHPCNFLMQIAAPPAFYGNDTRLFSFLCHAGNLPGVGIEVSPEHRIGYGPSKKVPHNVGQTDINLTFYSDGAGTAIDFFDQWLRNIVSYGDVLNPIQGAAYGQVQYPEHYETTLELLYFNENPGYDGRELITYRFYDAYPIGMTEIPLDWNAQNQYSSFSIPFTYRTFQIIVNDVGGYGSEDAIVPNQGYLMDVANSYSGSYASINTSLSSLFQQSESISRGSIGFNTNIPGFSAVLGSISSSSNSLGNKLNIVGALNGAMRGNVGGGLSFP
jgi:hypothetical protein